MTKRKALGSGLEALLSNKPDSNTEKLKQNKTQKKQNISKNEIGFPSFVQYCKTKMGFARNRKYNKSMNL